MFYFNNKSKENFEEEKTDQKTIYMANIAYTVLAIITLLLEFNYLKKKLSESWTSTFCEMLGSIFTQAIPLSSGIKLINLNKSLKKTKPNIVLVESRYPSTGSTYTPPSIPPYVRSTYGGKKKGKK